MLFTLPLLFLFNVASSNASNVVTYSNYATTCKLDSDTSTAFCENSDKTLDGNKFVFTDVKNITMCKYHMCMYEENIIKCSGYIFLTEPMFRPSKYMLINPTYDGVLTRSSLKHYGILPDKLKDQRFDGYSIPVRDYFQNVVVFIDDDDEITSVTCEDNFVTCMETKNTNKTCYGNVGERVVKFHDEEMSFFIGMVIGFLHFILLEIIIKLFKLSLEKLATIVILSVLYATFTLFSVTELYILVVKWKDFVFGAFWGSLICLIFLNIVIPKLCFRRSTVESTSTSYEEPNEEPQEETTGSEYESTSESEDEDENENEEEQEKEKENELIQQEQNSYTPPNYPPPLPPKQVDDFNSNV